MENMKAVKKRNAAQDVYEVGQSDCTQKNAPEAGTFSDLRAVDIFN